MVRNGWTCFNESALLEIVGTEGILAIHNRLREGSLSRSEPDLFRVAADAGIAICGDVEGFDDRNGILAMIVEGDLTDDGVPVLHVGEISNDFLTVGPDLLNRVKDHVHRRDSGMQRFGR